MIVKIKSTDQEIDYDIPCYSEDPFYIVEEKLYEKFERYREKNTVFQELERPPKYSDPPPFGKINFRN